MTWDNVDRGDIVYKIEFDDNLSVVLEAVTVIDKTEDINRSVIILFLKDGSELTLTAKDFKRLVIKEDLTIAKDSFYYPDKTQLIDKTIEDIRDTKALYDKSIEEVQENCMRLLDRKEDLTDELLTETYTSFVDCIKLGNSIYANIADQIICFTIVDIDIDNITAISLEGKSMVILNIRKNKFGDRSFLKDNVIYYFTQTEAKVYEKIDNINRNFNYTQNRLEELTAESTRLKICIKNLENYNEDKKLEINTTRK